MLLFNGKLPVCEPAGPVAARKKPRSSSRVRIGIRSRARWQGTQRRTMPELAASRSTSSVDIRPPSLLPRPPRSRTRKALRDHCSEDQRNVHLVHQGRRDGWNLRSVRDRGLPRRDRGPASHPSPRVTALDPSPVEMPAAEAGSIHVLDRTTRRHGTPLSLGTPLWCNL